MQAGTKAGSPTSDVDIIGPDHPDYDETRRVWNGMIDHHPALIARPTSAGEVAAAIVIARQRGLPLSVRGGGHNAAGLAVGDGSLVVDLAAMRGVEVDPIRRRARVGGGARWANVDEAAQAYGLATPGGAVSDTGVAGLTLSGGLGWLRRKHGLSCDALRAAEVATADGRILRASPEEHADLFWALRGGGGNFGVVTEFEFELYPVGPIVSTTVALYPMTEAAARLREFRDMAASLPDEVSSLADLAPIPDDEAFPALMRGGEGLVIMGVAATDVDAGAKMLEPLAALGHGALADVGGALPFVDVQKFFDADYPAGTMRYYWKSSFSDDPSDALIDRLVERFRVRPSHHSTIDFWPNLGAISRISTAESPFGHRDAAWVVSAESNWEAASDDEANVAWARAAVGEVGGSQYLNFPGLLEAGAQEARSSFGPAFQRLGEVKREYDPDNLFRFNANILPATYSSR